MLAMAMSPPSIDAVGFLIFLWCCCLLAALSLFAVAAVRSFKHQAFFLQPTIGVRWEESRDDVGSAWALPFAVMSEVACLILLLAGLGFDRWASSENEAYAQRNAQYYEAYRYGLVDYRETRYVASNPLTPAFRQLAVTTYEYDCGSAAEPARCFGVAGTGALVLTFGIIGCALCVRKLMLLLPCSRSLRETHDAPLLWTLAVVHSALLFLAILVWLVVACVSLAITPSTSLYLFIAAALLSLRSLLSIRLLLEAYLPPAQGVHRNQVGVAPNGFDAASTAPDLLDLPPPSPPKPARIDSFMNGSGSGQLPASSPIPSPSAVELDAPLPAEAAIVISSVAADPPRSGTERLPPLVHKPAASSPLTSSQITVGQDVPPPMSIDASQPQGAEQV